MPFYTPPTEPLLDIDQDPNYVVPVIASFSTRGGIQPLYFQHNDRVIKIHSVHWCDQRANVIRFECTAVLDQYLTEINLTFFPIDNRWVMKPR